MNDNKTDIKVVSAYKQVTHNVFINGVEINNVKSIEVKRSASEPVTVILTLSATSIDWR